MKALEKNEKNKIKQYCAYLPRMAPLWNFYCAHQKYKKYVGAHHLQGVAAYAVTKNTLCELVKFRVVKCLCQIELV